MGIRQNEQKINLLSMTDFVLEQTKINQFRDDCEFAYPVRKYANFLKQPLELRMFVPCDEDGNVLEEPNPVYDFDTQDYDYLYQQYQHAKEICLFEGFEYKGETEFLLIFKHNNVFPIMIAKRDIEYLNIYFKKEIQLTPTAQKQLGL